MTTTKVVKGKQEETLNNELKRLSSTLLSKLTRVELSLLVKGYLDPSYEVYDNGEYYTVGSKERDSYILRAYKTFSPMVSTGTNKSYWVEKFTFDDALEYWTRYNCDFLKKEE